MFVADLLTYLNKICLIDQYSSIFFFSIRSKVPQLIGINKAHHTLSLDNPTKATLSCSNATIAIEGCNTKTQQTNNIYKPTEFPSSLMADIPENAHLISSSFIHQFFILVPVEASDEN
jgi:hypothetical protein